MYMPSAEAKCDAVLVDGFARGFGVGIVWGLVVAPVDERIHKRHLLAQGKAILPETQLQSLVRASAGTASSAMTFGTFCGSVPCKHAHFITLIVTRCILSSLAYFSLSYLPYLRVVNETLHHKLHLTDSCSTCFLNDHHDRLYSGTACACEKARGGRKDWFNQAVGGFVGGAFMARGGGPRSMALGAAATGACTSVIYLLSQPND